jgi:galactitol-specific phosphotransferase system IIC component
VNLGLRTRIPGTIWAALYFIAIFALGTVGYHAGLTGTRRSLAVLSLVLTFSAVMVLIADLDRPMEGLLKVSQQAMIDLRNSLMDPRP